MPKMRSTAMGRVLVVVMVLLGLITVGQGVAVAATGSPIVGVGSHRCLDVRGASHANSTGVMIYECNAGSNQSWTLSAAGELLVYDAHTCLDVQRARTTPRAPVIIYPCNGGANQKWKVNANGTIVGVQSGLCLEVTRALTGNSIPVRMYTCNGGDHQKWTTSFGAPCAKDVCGATQVATDTDIPWGLLTLPDGTILYSRRNTHNIIRLDPLTGAKIDVGTVPGVVNSGEGGLLGLAIAPTFYADHWLYIMHTAANDNRIIRMKLVNNSISAEQVLLTGIPKNSFHDGGRLRIGPDGKLYASTGDAGDRPNAQNKNTLNGKVLRLNTDGTVPADNPFHNYVWSFGHRNPQGLAFDSRGRLWEQEFGQDVMDETNLIVKGGNYGWPDCEGTTGSCSNPAFIAPKRTYATSEGSCSGITIVDDVLYTACQRGQRLYRSVISGSSLQPSATYFQGTYGRLRTVEPAPGGDLWLTTTNGGGDQILRVTLRG